MSNVSCSAFSVDKLLAQAGQHSVNITTIIRSCPNICLLLQGTGNPDLSGVGMHISYITQAVLTFLCGPLFYLIYLLRHKLDFDKNTLKGMVSIQHTFVDASATFVIPVSFAAVMRIRQHPPLYELSMLGNLIYMQGCSLVCVSLVALSTLSEFWPYHKKWKRLSIIFIYDIVEVGLSWGRFGSSTNAWRSWKAGLPRKLMEACGFEVVSPKRSGIALVITLTVVVVIILNIWGWSVVEGWKKWTHWLTTLLSFIWTGLSFWGLVNMQRMRDVTKADVGVDFQDDHWGFGQVIAVFLWIPLCVRIILHVIRVVNRYAMQMPVVEDQEMQGTSERLGHAIDDYTTPEAPAAARRLWGRNQRCSTL